MGTCEDRCPSVDLANDIILDADSNVLVHHTVAEDRDDSSEQALIQKLQDSHIEEKGREGGGGGGEVGEETGEEKVELEGGEETAEEEVELEGCAEEECNGNGRRAQEGEGQKDTGEDEKNYEGLQYENKVHPYPLRSNAEDCSFYMKTGSCKYGFSCRFNHPVNRVSLAKDSDADSKEHEDAYGIFAASGKIECKYQSTPGGCKFGESCRYSHSKEQTGIEQLELNFLGLPIRKGERECPFYMRNGSCGYGPNCRFHHPDPTAAMEEPKNFEPNGGALQKGKSFSARNIVDCAPSPVSSRPRLISNSSSSENILSCMPWMNTISQRIPQGPQLPLYNQYQAPASLHDKTLSSRSAYSLTSPLKKEDSFGFAQQVTQNEEFPERPGYPECDHFIKTGTCKFGSACRFHHPKSRLYSMSNGATHNPTKEFSHLTYRAHADQMEEYPERPGEPECAYFIRTRECKYKSACKFNHPKSWNNKSAASAYAMNGFSPRSDLVIPHEVKKLPGLYPNCQYQTAKPLMHHQQPTRGDEFPDRPGQPECEYFMKNGDCKYKAACKFHHPKNSRSQVSTGSDFSLNEKGLPLRPGVKTCRNYEQLGICKYGPRCLFDHPSSSNSSALAESPAPQSPPGHNSGWGDGWGI